MDFKLNRETFLKLTDGEIIDLFNGLTHFKIYSISNSWRSDPEYILKARGSNGDILVYWNEELSWHFND